MGKQAEPGLPSTEAKRAEAGGLDQARQGSAGPALVWVSGD